MSRPSARFRGQGLVNLYAAVAKLEGRRAQSLDDKQIVAQAKAGGDPLCVAAVETFFALLGGVAGNLALMFGARGGVCLGGGIVPRFETLSSSGRAWRERFEAKGRFAGYLAAIPMWIIDAKLPPALIGAARALDQDS